MKPCTYCKEQKELTREHVYPNALIQLFPEATHAYMGEEKVIPLSPSKHVIKDVCQQCNNVHLKRLDDVGTQFIKDYFLKENWSHDPYKVSYDYDNLAKWILKIIYNNTRSYKEIEHPWFDLNSKFLIGETNSTTSDFSLMLGFHLKMKTIKGIFPEKPFETIKNPIFVDDEKIRPPYKTYEVKHVQAIYITRLGTAVFLVLLWNEKVSEEQKNTVLKEIESNFPYTCLSPLKKESQIYRVSDFVNDSNLFLVNSKSQQKYNDLYQLRMLTKGRM